MITLPNEIGRKRVHNARTQAHSLYYKEFKCLDRRRKIKEIGQGELERNRKYRNVGMKRRWMKICVNEQEMECTASVCGKATRERGA